MFNTLIGIYNPSKHEVKSYKGYDITKLKDNVRFIQIIENREGRGNETCPLLFYGDVNYFEELPLPKDNKINDYYNKLN